jgi:drug/metabolite transporter (DMT)-like permease
MAPASALCIFTGSLIFEVPTMISKGDHTLIMQHWHLFLLASTLGLAINLCSFLVIQLTSGVTIKILGTVRNALLVLFTVFGQGAKGESVSSTQFIGYFVTLLGFTAYNYFKMQKPPM